MRKNLEDAITSLPPKCREVFMMSYIEDLPNKDISARLGISLSTVFLVSISLGLSSSESGLPISEITR